MKAKILWTSLAACVACLSGTVASAYTFLYSSSTQMPVKWTPSVTQISVKIMADNSAVLGDGSTRAMCIQAAMTDPSRGWNRHLGNAQFVAQIVAGASGTDGNRVNEIFFSSAPYNQTWDSHTLALTTSWVRGNERVESDIIINTAYTWDSYRGSLRSGTIDLFRVVQHELGHVLGLDHPDQATPPQSVAAQMNSAVSNLDTLTDDDITGAEKLYGPSPYGSVPANDAFSNAGTLVLSGSVVRAIGTNVNATRESGEPLSADNAGGRSVWWKWTAPSSGNATVDTQGSLFDTLLRVYAGSTLPTLALLGYSDDVQAGVVQYSTVSFAATSGTTYYFVVDGFNGGDAAGADCAAVSINLNFAGAGGTSPAISSQPMAATIGAGGSVTFSVTASGNNLSFQWYKDGVPLNGATGSTFTVANVQTANAGQYSVVVSNAGGSISSNGVQLSLGDALPAMSVAAGHDVSFRAQDAVGTVRWQVSTDLGATWTDLSDGGVYRGTATATLTLTGVTASYNAYRYRYVATLGNNSSTSNGAVLTVAAAVVPYPACITLGASGVIVVGDSSINTFQTINSSGITSLLAGKSLEAGTADGSGASASFSQPAGIVYHTDGFYYASDTGSSTIRRIAANGTVTTLAGSPTVRGNADATGAAASFSSPIGIASGPDGIYIADSLNHTVRKVTANGVVTTFAGRPGVGGSSDGLAAVATFNHPSGVAVDATGNVYLSDSTNNTIRMISSIGVVSTLAGTPGVSGSENGAGASASFNNPTGLALDRASGRLYVADTGNSAIRVVTIATGAVTQLAGLPTVAGLADGRGYDAMFNQPRGVALDGSGNLYVADTGNAAVRKVALSTYEVSTVSLTVNSSTSSSSSSSGGSGSSSSSGSSPSSAPSGGGGGAESLWFCAALGVLTAAKVYLRCHRSR